MINPTFTKVNRLFVLSFENENDRTSFSKYYVPIVQIKDLIVLINGKSFFDMPVKNGAETYEHIIEMERNNDYTTGNLLDYEYFSKHFKLIAKDLTKQSDLENPDLNKLISLEDLQETKEQQYFPSLKSQKQHLLNFHKMLQQLFDFDYV